MQEVGGQSVIDVRHSENNSDLTALSKMSHYFAAIANKQSKHVPKILIFLQLRGCSMGC